jgi:transposase
MSERLHDVIARARSVRARYGHVSPRTRDDQLYERHTEVRWADAGIVSERAVCVWRALASTG